jgi:phage terminase large subunit
VIEFTQNVRFLFEPHRYKVLYGGRGGKKSWDMARALLILGTKSPERILCTREFQNSISDSVHKLLSDQITELGLNSFYQVLQTSIKGPNNTEFLFAGLRHNISNLKSYEGVTKVWVEEAQNTSKNSWKTLIPTIRREGSEIWASFNPELEEDETYQRFVINPPPNAKVLKVGWQDNPWFPDVLRQEMDYLKEKDYDSYLNVWEGYCRQTLDGAVFADEIRATTIENRITRVPYDAAKPVHTFWDLGRRDGTAIWFLQNCGLEYHFIDYHFETHKGLPHHLKILKDKSYMYECHWLPHDAEYEHLISETTIKKQVQEAFPNCSVQIVEGAGKPGSITTGINAVRTVFNRCLFDKEKCSDGMMALRHWHYDKDEVSGKTSLTPVHDWSSHGSSAFMYFAMSLNKLKINRGNAPIKYPDSKAYV